MPTIWFCLIAFMIAMYVLLDGFDIGAGILYLGVARTEAERRAVIGSIGPVWDGNEVWLIAGSGTLFFAFPVLYAAGLSGFYLPLMIVLWLLILRGISIEFRSLVSGPLWPPFWDSSFCISSALLAIFFGAALGNVIRGVPLDRQHYFFEPLWTNFRFGADAGILDWYTILVGVTAYLALAVHGALWVGYKCENQVAARARRVARVASWGVLLFTSVVTAVTFRIQSQILANLTRHYWGFLFPIIALAGLYGVLRRCVVRSRRSASIAPFFRLARTCWACCRALLSAFAPMSCRREAGLRFLYRSMTLELQIAGFAWGWPGGS